MKLENLLRNECIVANSSFDGKDNTLAGIAKVAKNCQLLADVSEEEILVGLRNREKLGSTGFGKGIAIPHCRLESVKEFVVGVITVPDGVDFDAADGEAVKLIIFIIAPDHQSNAHVRLLSAISRALIKPEVVTDIIASDNADAIRQHLIGQKTENIDINGKQDKKLLHVIIQKEDIYRDIVQAIATTVTNSLAVVDAENSQSYMQRIPLFADMWGDETNRFSKMVIAVIEAGLVNEAIRAIETVSGELSKNPGVMVLVQDVAVAAGSLEEAM